jgi:DNA-binding MarR family transcriptional regulator
VTLISLTKYTIHVPAQTASAPSLPELASTLRLRVMRLSRNLRRQAGTGLSASLLSALTTVERRGPMTIGTLSEAEQVKPPTMTKVVASLVEQGLVSRDPDPLDGRVAWVMATSEGRALVRRTRSRSDAYLAKRLRSLDSEDLLVLERASRLLERLTEEAP